MTEYVVFRGKEDGWEVFLPSVEAASGKAAVNVALKQRSANGYESGTYVAVPARSWQPVKVQVETALKFS